jgi:acyl-CoA thioesterase
MTTTPPRPTDPESVARRSAEVMLAGDTATAALGMQVVDVGPGTAVVHMVVRPDMLNGWGSAHGGMVASLADTAFAVACNSHGEVTVAAGFDISFLAPARLGDLLVATASRRSSSGRSGIYDVSVERVDDDHGGRVVVAEFRGRSRSLGRPVEPDAGA